MSLNFSLNKNSFNKVTSREHLQQLGFISKLQTFITKYQEITPINPYLCWYPYILFNVIGKWYGTDRDERDVSFRKW